MFIINRPGPPLDMKLMAHLISNRGNLSLIINARFAEHLHDDPGAGFQIAGIGRDHD